MGPGSRGACHRAARRADPLAWPGRQRDAGWAKALMPPGPPFLVRITYEKGGQSAALPTLRAFVGISARHHVTHLPGCRSFATSVSTLTTGSQATVIFFALSLAGFTPGALVGAGGRLRASFCAGIRTSTGVSPRLSTFRST